MNSARRLAALTGLLVALSTLALGLLAVRHRVLGSVGYWFLVWNLFLAWIPYALSIGLAALPRRRRSARLATAIAWLLFLPNAPYLLTDVIHLRNQREPVGWLDVVLVVTFVVNGLLLGFVSLLLVHGVLLERVRRTPAWAIMGTIIGLCSFGIALGRIDRWNSWDVVHRPGALAADIATTIFNPLANPISVGVTLAVTAFLSIGYLFVYVLANGPLRLRPTPCAGLPR